MSADTTFQAGFEQRWGHLTRPHVRALAWLLDAPDLLDAASPHWHGRIASLGPVSAATAEWLAALERDPAPLDAVLGQRFYSRLGLYAEKLMSCYFQHQGTLVAHGLQVRASRNDTVGEFDFLLRDGARLLHWEFATKFYLLDQVPGGTPGSFNGLIGPNLADTLGAKMRKIFDKQLSLAQHPAAQPLLPQPVDVAQALVKGWLFYPGDEAVAMAGVSQPHCHGYWITLQQLAAQADDGQRHMLLPRLLWLAPLKAPQDSVALTREELVAVLSDQMAAASAPIMVAQVAQVAQAGQASGWWIEQRRGFVVPDNWRAQAASRRAEGVLPA